MSDYDRGFHAVVGFIILWLLVAILYQHDPAGTVTFMGIILGIIGGATCVLYFFEKL